MSFRGQGQDKRLDTTHKYIQESNERIKNRIDTVVEVCEKLSEQIKTLQEQQEYVSNVVHSLNKDVKKLESKPDPVIPLMPDLTPMRSEVKLIRATVDEVILSHNDEMTELWKNLQEIHHVRKDLLSKIEAIKIPSHARIYIAIVALATFVGVLMYV